MEVFFPGRTKDARETEFYIALKKRTRLLLDSIAGTKKGADAEIAELDTYMLTLYPPQSFAGSDGAEVSFIRSFEQACHIISAHIAKDPKRMTALEFLQNIELLKQRSKKK